MTASIIYDGSDRCNEQAEARQKEEMNLDDWFSRYHRRMRRNPIDANSEH